MWIIIIITITINSWRSNWINCENKLSVFFCYTFVICLIYDKCFWALCCFNPLRILKLSPWESFTCTHTHNAMCVCVSQNVLRAWFVRCDDIAWVIRLWFMQMHRRFSAGSCCIWIDFMSFLSLQLLVLLCVCVRVDECVNLNVVFHLLLPFSPRPFSVCVYICACRSANCHLNNLMMVRYNIRLYFWHSYHTFFMCMCVLGSHLYISTTTTTKYERVSWSSTTIWWKKCKSF